MEAMRPQEEKGDSASLSASAPPAEKSSTAAMAAEPSAAAPRQSEEAAAKLEACERQLAEAEAKRDEYLDLARRIQADFANYRKRVERERQQWQQEALAAFLQEFLGYFDDFRRALAEAAKTSDFASFNAGMRLIYDNLWKAMAKAGVECIDPQGANFDPAWHEAIATIPSGDRPPQTVIDVVQNGYRLGDTLIRPARVVVAVAASVAASTSEEAQSNSDGISAATAN